MTDSVKFQRCLESFDEPTEQLPLEINSYGQTSSMDKHG